MAIALEGVDAKAARILRRASRGVRKRESGEPEVIRADLSTRSQPGSVIYVATTDQVRTAWLWWREGNDPKVIVEDGMPVEPSEIPDGFR